MIKLIPNGEVSERFKELVLKTSDAAMHRGFESHPLRHIFSCNMFIIHLFWRNTQVVKGLPC